MFPILFWCDWPEPFLTRSLALEKIEEAKAKAAIKAQIEADKKARAERTAKEKALREGKEWTDAGAVDKPGASAAGGAGAASSGVKGADYKETRLQVGFFLRYFNVASVTDWLLIHFPVQSSDPRWRRCTCYSNSTE